MTAQQWARIVAAAVMFKRDKHQYRQFKEEEYSKIISYHTIPYPWLQGRWGRAWKRPSGRWLRGRWWILNGIMVRASRCCADHLIPLQNNRKITIWHKIKVFTSLTDLDTWWWGWQRQRRWASRLACLQGSELAVCMWTGPWMPLL